MAKKVRDQPLVIRETWISKEDEIPLVRQCMLAGVCRPTIYERQKPRKVGESDLLLSQLIDKE